MARFLTSHVGLLIGCELLTCVALILFVIALCAGMSRGPLEGLAILTVDASSLTSSTSGSALGITDWYEAHYLSICSGMWNRHIASAGKNHSTITCTSQSAGYTFSLARIVVGGDAAQQTLLANHRTLNTKAPFVLLVVAIASMSLAILSFLYGIAALPSTAAGRRLSKKEIPLVVLRIGFFACVTSTVLLSISSAKITANAAKTAGRVQLGGGKDVHAWMDGGFYAVTWVGAACVWVALGLVVAAAFKLADVLERKVVMGPAWAQKGLHG
ncbi:uncharacterized protein PV07_10217 [Cladophialophora immunda]|uniref:MARVEL domain-containing protein n=1 Tax=Cladophialophora immunda TaxID=569365 RepID=A0A0D1Z9Z6_9EURO|nr:uncharacterized protein PV07_10217 [Cladophialophora immunda]KIW24506.1 hypothetical protein PV07_10217 [Cladophialophora immunda]OQV09811.1 hypothetical protein CLAIMM_13895 [Cladophialophora immunda]